MLLRFRDQLLAAGGGLGDLGKRLFDAQTPLCSIELDVLDAEANATLDEIYNGGEMEDERMKPQNLLMNLPLARRA
ncbi:MAG: hypothetical protein HY525_01560 [Betaproteobacteria bacterium]|nr:hypothetical protein [Betaproteobacteria bacterium]